MTSVLSEPPLDDETALREIDAIIARLDAELDRMVGPGRIRQPFPLDNETAEREIDEIIARLDVGIAREKAEMSQLLAGLRSREETA